MSEFRRDPFLGRWTIVAEGRSARPNEYTGPPPPAGAAADCPFCEGHESRTPPEVAAVRPSGSAPNGPGWTARAIPNRFPTVTLAPTAPAVASTATLEREPALGIHEVIVEDSRHGTDLPYLPADQHRTLFRFFRDRMRAALGTPGVSNVLLFENRGPESGGTLPHPHAQLVASHRIPARLEEERRAFRTGGADSPGTCRLEKVVESELHAGERVVAHEGALTAFAPFASDFPYEVWIVPDRHAASFADATDVEVDGLASLLPQVLRALDRVRSHPSYNWFVHGDRASADGTGGFHWHVEVVPRLVRPDGYELGSGVAVNPVRPETAAAELRTAMAAVATSAGQQP